MDVELKIRRAEAIPLSERLYELGYDVAYVDVPCGPRAPPKSCGAKLSGGKLYGRRLGTSSKENID